MQPARPPPRAPGSFSPLPGSTASNAQQSQAQRPRPPARADSSSSEENLAISFVKPRAHAPSAPTAPSTGTPIYAQFTANSSTASLQNFSRPTAQRSGTTSGGGPNDLTINVNVASAAARTASPLTKGHSRKHSQTPGLFDSTLPSTSTSNLSHVGMSQPASVAASSTHQHQHHHPSQQPSPALSASQIAAQAAVLHHQTNHQQQQHIRQRSQTVPTPSDGIDNARRGSSGRGPLSPPMLSLTEASAPRDSGFGNQGYHNGLLGSRSAAATSAANAAFPRSGQTSPGLPQSSQIQQQQIHHPQQQHQPQLSPVHPPPQLILDPKPQRLEKSKVKLFSRPVKIGTKGDPKDKPPPSPSKIGSALASLQRGNFSTSSLIDTSGQSLYNLNNSSTATVRQVPETPTMEKPEGKEKEKKHHFLSRQKHKLKDDYHLPLSSASSNSKPTDPNAPSSLYNFNLPPSPAPTATSFGKVRRDKKADKETSNLGAESNSLPSEWPGPSSLPSLTHQSSYLSEPIDAGKYGLNSMAFDDAWPFLKARMLNIFEGEDLRQPIEDFNRLVTLHIQYCIQRRSPNIILEDLRELLATGFASLDHTLRRTQEDKVIPALVEMWLITYTSILPYMQAVFLPLDLEFSGCGVLMNPDQARDFWGGVKATPMTSDNGSYVSPAAAVLDVRRIVLTAYRDIVILPRYESLKTIFSRLSLEFLPSSFASMALASPLPDPLSSSPADNMNNMMRPGTAMSLDPSVASYNSNATTLLGDGSAGGRSRAISNVSYASAGSDGQLRPFTREQNVEDSKQVTEMVGRMLQCMSILASVGDVAGDGSDAGNKRMEELCRLLKLNWLGRGRTGRNRRGIVGGRRREIPESVREGLRVI
ncbi:Target of rapamycin complex 2 subunit bit61 [Colletotrichum spinosum]|uniref:Target of rapamycin complex 2 subunit bit61 n=1 Tax=Colletotrichum spinosum TaxID=1347390 RepID=A0A4R8QAB9_9PEZI|nr:Target of rapamycin complex 2 subunit bit61 [Colletotrichum spinosum]